MHHTLTGTATQKQAVTATPTTRTVVNTWRGSETDTSLESQCFRKDVAVSKHVRRGREHPFTVVVTLGYTFYYEHNS